MKRILKEIEIAKDNIFGHRIGKKTSIHFDDLKQIVSKKKTITVSQFGQKLHYHSIYVLGKNGIHALIDLPFSNNHCTTEPVFMRHFKEIIRNQNQSE